LEVLEVLEVSCHSYELHVDTWHKVKCQLYLSPDSGAASQRQCKGMDACRNTQFPEYPMVLHNKSHGPTWPGMAPGTSGGMHIHIYMMHATQALHLCPNIESLMTNIPPTTVASLH